MAARADDLAIEPPRVPERARASRVGLQLPDDRYIPVHSEDLVAAIRGQPERFPELASEIEVFAKTLDRVIDQEVTAFQRVLARQYDTFNPARETIVVDALMDADTRAQELEEVRGMVAYLLDKANYERLDDDQVSAAIGVANSHGIRIRVNPDRLQRLDLYVRGQAESERRVRTVRRPIKGEMQRVEIFRRLAVVFQMRGEDRLNLKLFRDIPVVDVEALLPHAEVEMSTFDRVKILGGGLGAFGGVVTKLITGTAALGQLAWAGIAALLGLSVRSFFGYRRAKHQRTYQMTHNLYYQNVANNAGVIDMLLGNIEQEELKEALVAYAMLRADPSIDSNTTLAAITHAWLHDTFDLEVDFDVTDALETLDRLHLWTDRAAFVPLPPAEALTHLEQHWRTRESITYHIDAYRARVTKPA